MSVVFRYELNRFFRSAPSLRRRRAAGVVSRRRSLRSLWISIRKLIDSAVNFQLAVFRSPTLRRRRTAGVVSRRRSLRSLWISIRKLIASAVNFQLAVFRSPTLRRRRTAGVVRSEPEANCRGNPEKTDF